MMNIYRFKLNYFKFILYLIILVFVLTCIHPTFMLDESFTFGLISHSFINIINLDALDVHPPLYYLVLKLFLIITTFWTKSIFIKVIFARIFSLLSFLIYIYIGVLILYEYNIIFKLSNLLIVFMLMPPIVINILKIRMYSLSSLFVLMTFYMLLKFNNNQNKNILLVYSVIFATLSAYTFYFAGLSSGLFIAIFCMINLIHKNWKSAIKLFISCIVLFISFLPWLVIAIKQLLYHSKFDGGINNNIIIRIIYSLSQLNPNGIISVVLGSIISLFIIFLVIYIFINSSNNLKKLFSIVIINYLCTLIISNLLCGHHFQAISLYPIYMILSFLLSVVIINIMKHYSFYCKICIIFIALLSFYSCAHVYKNISIYDIPSVNLLKEVDVWKDTSNKNIVLRTIKFPVDKSMTISEDAVYLKSLNKNLVLRNYSYNKLSSGLLNSHNNIKLIKSTFTNIYVINK